MNRKNWGEPLYPPPPGLPQESCLCFPEQCTCHVKSHGIEIHGISMILTLKWILWASCNWHSQIYLMLRLFHNDSNWQFDSVVYDRHVVIEVLELASIAIHLNQKYLLPFTQYSLNPTSMIVKLHFPLCNHFLDPTISSQISILPLGI